MVVRAFSGKSLGRGDDLEDKESTFSSSFKDGMAVRNIGAFRVKTNLASNPHSQFTNCVTLEKSPGISLSFKTHLPPHS